MKGQFAATLGIDASVLDGRGNSESTAGTKPAGTQQNPLQVATSQLASSRFCLFASSHQVPLVSDDISLIIAEVNRLAEGEHEKDASSEVDSLHEDLYDILNTNKQQAWWWLDCCNVTETEIVAIADAIGGIHPLTIERIMENSVSLDSMQELPGYRLATFNALGEIPHLKNPVAVPYSLLTKRRTKQLRVDGAVSFHNGANEAMSIREDVVGKILRHNEITVSTGLVFSTSLEWCVFLVMERIVESFIPALRHLEEKTNWLNEHVYMPKQGVKTEEILQNLARTRADCLVVSRLVRSKGNIVQAFSDRIPPELNHHYCNILETLDTIKRRLVSLEGMVSNTHRNWFAVVQMNTERNKSRILNVIGQYVGLATVFMPLLGVYVTGHMNVHGPYMMTGKSNLNWWGVMNSIIIGLSSTVIFVAWRYARHLMAKPPPSLTET